ncbi:MAG TPA: HAMP domain-containing sensor histidine kinase [Elusimicrobiales bacterium]|nr:HAMP domain-containing sensor histidine kinase [Elusimicrobiales bacterium]
MFEILGRLTDTRMKSLVVSALLVLVIGYADYYTGDEIAVSFFYLIPVMLVTWRIGFNSGLAVSIASVIVWFLADHALGARNYAHPLIPYWNALVGFVFFVVSVVLLNRVKTLLSIEKAQSKLKSSMLHTVSHEFNNSLTVMSTGIFLLKETEPAPADETRARLLATLENTQSQLSLYVKNILNEARMEDGRFKLDKKPLAMRELAADCAASVRDLVKQKSISLEVKMPEHPVFVSADKEALALVVSNLLGNAIKYTPARGRIAVEIAPSGEQPPKRIIFSVEDTGIGISLADLKKITAGFYRTEEGRSTADGFGLGLKIANELLVLHGSRLEISSEKGKGTSFFFELPALPPEKA